MASANNGARRARPPMIKNGMSTSRRAMPTPNTLAKLEDPRAWHARGEVGIQKSKPSSRTTGAIALVMAPPPPKGRPVAAKKVVLEEDEYVEQLGDIIEGDYFPHNAKMKRALSGLAQGAGNNTPSGRGFIGTPSSVASSTPGGSTPGPESGAVVQGEGGGKRAAKQGGAGGALTKFVATHTSEDNQAFAELQEKDQEAFRRRYFWAYETADGEGNNATSTKLLILPDGKMMSVERREQMDAACADRPKIGDHRPNQVETWKHRTRNQLMFSPNLVASRDTCRLEEEPAPAAPLLLTGATSKSGTKRRMIKQAGEVGRAVRAGSRTSAAAAAATAAAATAADNVDTDDDDDKDEDVGVGDDDNDDGVDIGDNDDGDDDDDSDDDIDVGGDDDVDVGGGDDIDVGDDSGDPSQSLGAVGIEGLRAVTTVRAVANPTSERDPCTRDLLGNGQRPRVAAVEQPAAAHGVEERTEENLPVPGWDDVPESPQPHDKTSVESQPPRAVPRAPVVVQTNVKTIQAHATRFPVPQARQPRQGAWASPIERPSSSRESVAELLAGNAEASDYAEVPMTPSRVPGLDGDSPQITWGSIDGTPMILDPRATPLPDGAMGGAVDVASIVGAVGGTWGGQKFEVKDLPPRDKLAHRLEAVDTRRKRAKLGLVADGRGTRTPVPGTPLTPLTPRTPGTGRRTPGTSRTPGGRTPGKTRSREPRGGAAAPSTPAARALAAKLALRQSVSTPFGGGLTPGRQKKHSSRSSKAGVGSRGEKLTPLPSTPSEGGKFESAIPVVSKRKSGRGEDKRSSLTDGLLALK